MKHLRLLFYFLPFFSSVAAITLYGIIYSQNKTKILKYYLIFLFLLLFNVSYNFLNNYILINLNEIFGDNNSLRFIVIILSYEILFIWSAFFARYLFLILNSLVAYQINSIKRFFLSIITYLPIILCILPFIISKEKEKILKTLQFSLDYLINPVVFLILIYFLTIYIWNYKKIKNLIIKKIIKYVFIIIPISFSFIVFDFYNIYPLKISFEFLPENWVLLFSIFTLTTLSIFLFFDYYRKFYNFKNTRLINFKNITTDFNDSLKKYEKSNLDREKASILLKHLIHLMENERIYLNPALSLTDLSEITKEPRNTISEVLNIYKGQNFYQFVNSFRVEHAKKLLTNPVNINKNILEIAFDCGFNSKTTFYTAFKYFVGINPLEYRKRYFKKATLQK